MDNKWIGYFDCEQKKKLSELTYNRPFDVKLKLEYRNYFNLLITLIKEAKKLHYKNLLNKYRGNRKKIWKMINEIAGKSNKNKLIVDKIKQSNGTIINDEISISNEFNNFFINVGMNIENNILNMDKKNLSWDNLNKNCHVND